MDKFEWIKLGLDNGFCHEPVCATHDGIPADSEAEIKEWDEGLDPCQVVLRLKGDLNG